MALTITLDQAGPRLVGDRRVVTGQVTFDSSYPTGGESLPVKALGLDWVENLVISAVASASTTSQVIAWDKSKTAPLLLVFYGDNNNASDGNLIQVPNTTDLSATVARFEATGI